MSLKKLPSNNTRRADSKQAQVLAILHSKQGATIATIMEATGWQPHSVRGFLTAVVRSESTPSDRTRSIGSVACPPIQAERSSETGGASKVSLTTASQ
jgi:hypothetical protein